MARERKDNSIVSRPVGGLDTDSDPSNQADGSTTFALNAVEEAVDGQHFSKSNEPANAICTQRPNGYEIIGDKYIEDNKSVVILVNTEDTGEEIGLLDKSDKYTSLVHTQVLGLSIKHQCMIVYRLRKGKERVIYWVDGNAKARTFNLDRPYNFYTRAYQSYIKAGNNPDTYVGEKWDASSFDLIKIAGAIPFFSDVEVLETGNSLPGSYNFAIQLVDDDLNPTGWITTSNTVNIYNDSVNNSYHKIRGSKNINTTAQTFPRTNKAIKLTVTNLDTSFPYYRVAIIRAAGTNGEPEKVLVSELFSTSDSNFIYTGNDGSLKETSLNDIIIDNEVIFAPKYIEQLENKLTLENTKGPQINFCDFQKFASKIKTDVAYKEVLLNNILSEPNVKNIKSKFIATGYMPGEVESVGIVYIAKDWMSPVYHIPGRGADSVSDMLLYENENRYLDVHNCSTNNYWGKDYDGNSLVGKKQRHHRFPFRKGVEKPLFSKTSGVTNINKYKLEITITLNPAWTPGPIEYPDSGGEPALIPYIIQYQLDGNPTVTSASRLLTDTDIGTVITIYDGVVALEEIDTPEYGMLDPTCDLATLYQIALNERFLIDFNYASYVASTSVDTDVSEIFGFEFSNIEKPHPDVIGFYIVRNERLEDDKLIVDNAFFGSMTEFENYKAFGLLTPMQYYSVNNCGRTADAGKTLGYYDKGVWIFNPEYQFLGKKTEFDRVELEGMYTPSDISMPTISDTEGSACNGGSGSSGTTGSKGVYLDDVQAGTSYDPALNKAKNKDDDGFDLIIGYKNVDFDYTSEDDIELPSKKRLLHLNAAASHTVDSDIIYNTSVDNKIAVLLTEDAIDADLLVEDGIGKIAYGALVRDNPNIYSNFMTRAYYKEHNNPVLFGSETVLNGFEVFNGDAQISAITLVSSTYNNTVVADRPKKNRVWKIVVGAVLVVAGVVLTVTGAGAVLGSLVISYGVSLAMSGIKFEQFKSMIDSDYEKGLRETVTDGAVFETIRETVSTGDDTVRWFADRANNLYIESSVPVGLRAGLTSGITDFIDAPKAYDEEGFRTYLTEKLTVVDREQGSGRLYKGYASSEVYDMNLDYMRFNKQKIFTHLPIEYDCCSDHREIFPLRVHWSQTSFQEENIDNYRAFLPNNYRDIEGEHGEITGCYKLGNSLYIHTREAIWHLPQNNQERVTGDIISFIGTGEFFNILPRKILDDTLGSGGTQHNWATIKTKHGVIYISDVERKVYLHGAKLQDISAIKRRSWFQENMQSFLVQQIYELLGIDFMHQNNPANPDGVGYISAYDTRFERVIITKRDYKLLPEYAAVLELVSTRPTVIGAGRIVYAYDDGKFYTAAGHLSLLNQSFFEDRSFTTSFSFHTSQWASLHSYIPNYYIHTQNSLYATWVGDNNIYKHNKVGLYQTFRSQRYPFILEYVAKVNPLMEGVIEDISLYTIARVWMESLKRFREERLITFNKMELSNSYQCSGRIQLEVKETKPNPTKWYEQQTKNYGDRIPISRHDGSWNINQLRDYVIANDVALFSQEWGDIKAEFPIDRVVNLPAVSFSKSWTELQGFKDKYIVIRLIFDNFDNVNLIMNYSVTNEENSTK